MNDAVKRSLALLMLFFLLTLMMQCVLASTADASAIQQDEITEPQMPSTTTSPMNCDTVGIIIILLCFSGSALIISLVMRIKSKK